MNQVWNLNPIYLSFQDPAYERDFAALQKTIENFSDFTEALDQKNPLEGLKTGICMEESMVQLVNKLA